MESVVKRRSIAAGLAALVWASGLRAEEPVPAPAPEPIAAPVEGGPPSADSSGQRRQAQHGDVQKTVDKFKQSLPKSPLEDPSELPDGSDVPTVIGGSKSINWSGPAAGSPAAAPA